MESSGLGKLLPKTIGPKRRRKKQTPSVAETASSNGEAEQTRECSTISRQTTRSLASSITDGEEGSLPADDTDHDPRPNVISTHPSQIGYLTTSSPVVQVAHLPESLRIREPPSVAPDAPHWASSSSFAAPSTLDSFESTPTGLAPPRPKASRSPSPVGIESSTSGTHPGPERKARPADSDRASDSSRSAASLVGSDTGPAAKQETASGRTRLSRGQKVDAPRQAPRTPPAKTGPPVIVNTPPTPPNHALPSSQKASPQEKIVGPPAQLDAAIAKTMIHQRRGGSTSSGIGPSKLSNITHAPLTPAPAPESRPATPGNTNSGFFSSMISAVQNTASTFSNSISTTSLGQGGGGGGKSASRKDQEEVKEDNVEVEPAVMSAPKRSTDYKEPAVRTLGMGDLSLSHLGIEEPAGAPVSPATAKFPDLSHSRGRSDSAPADIGEVSIEPLLYEPHPPRSPYETSLAGDQTPSQGSIYEDKTAAQRSGSIRSAIGARRDRGSSAATNATGAAVGYPHASSGAPKLTGFAVASKKRNREFHSLFKSVPDDDYLIEDYSCALQREILAHGRLYVSEGHLCFSSNILGWVTTLVLSFDEIVSVEKRSTALVFKNGLEISTLHAKHVFASFTSRDSTYDLIVKIWKLGQPSLRSSLNGVRIKETGGDRTEKMDADSAGGSQTASGSEDESDEEGDEVYDEDEENEDSLELSQPLEALAASGAAVDKAATRNASGTATSGAVDDGGQAADSGAGGDFPGPATHAPTDCGDGPSHYDKMLGDDVIPAPLGKVYNLLFGPASAAWLGRFLDVDQKCTEIQMENKSGLTDEVKSRNFTYIKPLYGAIGPRQTKCFVTEQAEHLDLEKSVNIISSTQTPDVPNGNIFVVKTRFCLSWAENNATRIQVNCTIEWSGKSWLKGPIEKGANEGQTQYCRDLFASLRAAVQSRPKAGAPKPRKRGRKSKTAQASSPAAGAELRAAKTTAQQGWGLFEPARPLLGPLADTLKPLLTGNLAYGLLVGLLVAAWFASGLNSRVPGYRYGREVGYASHAERLGAYEDMWAREQSELWEWLEERSGLHELRGEVTAGAEAKVAAAAAAAAGSRTAGRRALEDKMSEREIREAIRVTEEKLRVFGSIISGEASASASSPHSSSCSASCSSFPPHSLSFSSSSPSSSTSPSSSSSTSTSASSCSALQSQE